MAAENVRAGALRPARDPEKHGPPRLESSDLGSDLRCLRWCHVEVRAIVDVPDPANERVVLCAPKPAYGLSSGGGDTRATVP
jgi:hypothetical protein